MNKRKVCFIITSKIHYGRSKYILQKIKDDPSLDLQIIVGASAILPTYGDILLLMEKDGFHYDAKITMTLEGGSSVAMAKTTGIGITEFATAFDNLRPDIIIVRGDRYEVLSAAVAGAYMNIPVAHIEGGDVTGTIDESVRHAITKFAHIHFSTNEESKQRIIQMGEHPDYVFNIGSPELEMIENQNFTISNDYLNSFGVGAEIDLSKPYLLVMQHPVTSEVNENRFNTEETLKAIEKIDMPAIWFWPNVDAGTDEVSKAIRSYREENKLGKVRFIKFIPAEQFVALLDGAACLVGNSSSGIKEASFLGIPVVNIGTRQQGRKRSENVIDVQYENDKIVEAVQLQISHGKYSPSHLYYQPNTSQKIVDILKNIKLYTQKRFFDGAK